MPRYALYLELMGGVVVFYFASQLSPDVGGQRTHQVLKRSAQVLLLMIMLAQSVVAGIYVVQFEWGSRPTVFNNYKAFANDAKYILRDYSLP